MSCGLKTKHLYHCDAMRASTERFDAESQAAVLLGDDSGRTALLSNATAKENDRRTPWGNSTPHFGRSALVDLPVQPCDAPERRNRRIDLAECPGLSLTNRSPASNCVHVHLVDVEVFLRESVLLENMIVIPDRIAKYRPKQSNCRKRCFRK